MSFEGDFKLSTPLLKSSFFHSFFEYSYYVSLPNRLIITRSSQPISLSFCFSFPIASDHNILALIG